MLRGWRLRLCITWLGLVQVEFDSRYGVKADVYSLGVVLHVMLTAKFPKTALNQPASIDEDIPASNGLRELLLAMLHGDPYQVTAPEGALAALILLVVAPQYRQALLRQKHWFSQRSM